MIIESESAYHFYVDEHEYLGMLTYAGQLSDFRASIIANKGPIKHSSLESISPVLRTCLGLLVDKYLIEQVKRDIPDPDAFKSDFIKKEEERFKDLQHFDRFAAVGTR